jgi:hypothetical protein
MLPGISSWHSHAFVPNLKVRILYGSRSVANRDGIEISVSIEAVVPHS